MARITLLLAIVSLTALFASSIRAVRAQTTAPATGTMAGTAYQLADQTVVSRLVLDEKLEPISGGRVSIPELEVDRALAADGKFDLRDLPASSDPLNPTEVSVVFTAPGLKSFTYLHLPVAPNFHPILTPVLTTTPRVDDLSYGRAPDRPDADPSSGPIASTANARPLGTACSAWFDTIYYPPQSIRVWENNHSSQVTPGQDDLVHVVDFDFYVKHVLPREWIPSWHAQALQAGAMAVKMFGWWHGTTFQGDDVGGTCYDVDSTTNYQVFDPYYATYETNAAVDATWKYYMIQGSGVLKTFYKSGFETDGCGQWFGSPAPGNDMSQYGSQACAQGGMPWFQILTTYYFPPAAPWTLVSAPTAPLVSIAPYSNAQVRLQWAGQPGLAYFLCYQSDFMASFSFAACDYLGLGVGSVTTTPPTGYDVHRYYKVLVCGAYCAAPRGGGVAYRDWRSGGTFFYGTAYYAYPNAVVTGRNLLTYFTSGLILYDGAYLFGGTPKAWCPSVPPSSNCGPYSWVSSNPWVTISQYVVPEKIWSGYLRLLRNAIGD